MTKGSSTAGKRASDTEHWARIAAQAFPAEGSDGRVVARILLDSALPQLDHLFDYEIPEELRTAVRIGQRVRVPFRSRERKSFGYIIAFAERSEFGGELAEIAQIVSPVPVLTPEVWSLARSVADRAGGSAGDILRLAIPSRMVRVEKKHLALRDSGAAPSDPDTSEPHPPEPDTSETETSTEPDEGRPSALRTVPEELAALATRLVAGERLAWDASHGVDRLDTGEWVGSWAATLAQLAIGVFAEGRSVIIAAPDYRDLDQLRDALAALGHADVVRVDARQANTDRYAAFLRALDPEPRIILGNRSAIYAPAHRLGAMITWDDGDPLLAEPRAPYVHARDAALVRAEASGAGLFFAAHSRSAEVERLVEIGYVKAPTNPPKRTRILHADASMTPDAFAGRVPEFVARKIREGLESGPVLVQVATPGYAPIAVCTDCGELARCGACAGPIGFRAAGRAACRWCGTFQTSWQCPTCSGRSLAERGMGSTRTVEQFERQFAGARVLLSDGDHPRERVDARPALVVATRGAEPLAAAGYRAVVLLDAERLLARETLRAGEDCLRWWENAAALAAPDGVCYVASGGGPVVRAFVTGRTHVWRQRELRDRRELRYPPAVRVASVTGGGEEVDRALAEVRDIDGVDVLGPTPYRPRADREADAGLVRAIVRFDYAQGRTVAKRLRGALVADAAGSASRAKSSRGKSGAPPRAPAAALRLRFDDRGVFDA